MRSSPTRSSIASACGRSRSSRTVQRSRTGLRTRSWSSAAASRPRNRAMAARPSRTAGARHRPVRRTRFRVHDDEGGRGDGLRVYAGLRSDPFFIDLPAFLGSVENDELAFRDRGENSLDQRERPRPRRRGRPRAAAPAGRWAAVRRGRRDRGCRQAPDPHRPLRPSRDQERDHGDEEVRPGQPRSGDSRSLQPGRRLPHGQGLPRRLPRPAERQPGVVRSPGRQHRLAAGAGRRPPIDRAAARRLHGGGRLQAVRRGQLSGDRADGARGACTPDLRRTISQPQRDGDPLHGARECRQRPAYQRRRRAGDRAGVRRLPLPPAAQSCTAR